jgi:hypothetical protein
MIDIVRRHEHNFLRTTSRQWIGKYVDTTTQSCQLHDSNLVNVELSRRLRWFDLNEPDPFHSLAPLSTIRGNKSTESFSYNAVRFLAGGMKKSKDWRAFMLDTYGDTDGIAPIKSARFWAAMLVGGYLYKIPCVSVRGPACMLSGQMHTSAHSCDGTGQWRCPRQRNGSGKSLMVIKKGRTRTHWR